MSSTASTMISTSVPYATPSSSSLSAIPSGTAVFSSSAAVNVSVISQIASATPSLSNDGSCRLGIPVESTCLIIGVIYFLFS